jgi:hypothetical protein
MIPFCYIITNSQYTRSDPLPTIEAVLANLKKSECPAYTAINRSPVEAYFADGTIRKVDFSGYVETCEAPPEKVAELEASLDKVIEEHEKRWAKIQASLKPGERYHFLSGELWIFKKDRQRYLDEELVKWRVRWKDWATNGFKTGPY